jgi:hypothetical protein
MKKRKAFKDLLVKVESGTADFDGTEDFWREDEVLSLHASTIEAAYNGSLDAAMSFHDAVLPGIFWQRRGFSMIVTDNHRCVNIVYGTSANSNPARAWLIAILRAIITRP